MKAGSDVDPALDTGAGGQTLLQQRLALFGKVTTVLNATFWPPFLLLWGTEPSAWRASPLSRQYLWLWIAINAGVSAALWRLAAGRRRSVGALHVLDAAGTLGMAVSFAVNKFCHPQPLFAAFDAVLALTALLLLRALLVPSSWRRTLVLGLLAMAPQVLVLAAAGRRFTMGLTGPGPLIGSVVNWSLMEVGLSVVASGVLYRLRRADATAWTPAQAESWWRDRGDPLDRGRGVPPPGSETIAVGPRRV